MNDFTKEELDEIKGWADYSVGSGLCHTETEPLYTKIQSMIDNYCEHYADQKTPPKTFSAKGKDINYWERRCAKCKRIYYE
mgnify:CR=1 FL=1